MMRDEINRLTALRAKLLTVFLDEADPDKWPGMETKEDRGDRYWCKKNAAATIAVVARIDTCLGIYAREAANLPPHDPDAALEPGAQGDDLEREVALAEAEASRALRRMMESKDTSHNGKAPHKRRVPGKRAGSRPAAGD